MYSLIFEKQCFHKYNILLMLHNYFLIQSQGKIMSVGKIET